MELSRHISSEAVEIPRSRITPSGYNPRRMSDGARKLLRANIMRLGVMGGIVWNARTGNLVGGHQKLSILDGLHRYGPEDGANDYLLRVERVDLSPREEREQNIFLNSPNAQGELDGNLLRDMVGDIDPALAGLDAFDLSLPGIATDAASADVPAPREAPTAEGRESIMARKDAAPGRAVERVREGNDHLTLVFRTARAKASFMERFGLRPMENIMAGEDLAARAMPVP